MKAAAGKRLYLQVLAAIVLGVLVGHFFPATGAKLKPLGDVFVRLIKMIIAPLVFCTVVVGIAGATDMKKAGRVGLKAILYFEAISTLALIIGLVVVNLVRPGLGIHAKAAELDAKSVEQYAQAAKQHSLAEFFSDIVPNNVVESLARGEILQILFFAVLFGIALANAGPKARGFVVTLEHASHGLFGVVALVMRVAPIGAFGAMAFTIGKHGLHTLVSLGKLMACFYATCFAFVLVVLATVSWFTARISIFAFLRYIKEELAIVLGTSSSESVLPQMMAKLEHLGCEKQVVRLVIPTGYSFNLDGTSIYLTMAVMFVAQAMDIPLTLGQQLTLLGVLLLTSKGAAGVTGSGFITLAATLSSVGTVPVAGLAMILGIDRFMSEARALTNLVGNGVATLAVSRWEGALDLDRAHKVLAGEEVPVLDEEVP
ncbi:MAG: dicarboxylate/amino acid:cation symporter [Myxococcales bacterium]|nr:dicarboxylate/amino acid:cation symporter [Myxococcales bacterium]